MANLGPNVPTGNGDFDRWLNLLWKYVIRLIPLPSQSGQSGKYLTTNGATLSWGTPSGGGGSIASNVISTDATIAADTSYIINDCLTITATFEVAGNAGVI